MRDSQTRYRVEVDIGGTFTGFALFDEHGREIPSFRGACAGRSRSGQVTTDRYSRPRTSRAPERRSATSSKRAGIEALAICFLHSFATP